MTLEEKLATCTTVEEMQSVRRKALEAAGVIRMSEGGDTYHMLEAPQVMERAAPPSSSGPLMCEVLYLGGNSRIEVSGSVEEIAAIKARLGQR